jgi:hypothetical protein
MAFRVTQNGRIYVYTTDVQADKFPSSSKFHRGALQEVACYFGPLTFESYATRLSDESTGEYNRSNLQGPNCLRDQVEILYIQSAGFNFALIEFQPIQRICAQKSFALSANSVCSDGNNFTFTSVFAVRLGNCSEEGNFERIYATRFLLVVGVCLLDWKY